MAQDNLERTDFRLLFDFRLRVLPDRPNVLILEITTPQGPFRFGMSQDMAEKVAGQIGEHAKLLRPERQNYPNQ